MKGSKTRKIIALMLIIFIIIATSNVFINKVSAIVIGGYIFSEKGGEDYPVTIEVFDGNGNVVDLSQRIYISKHNNNYIFKVRLELGAVGQTRLMVRDSQGMRYELPNRLWLCPALIANEGYDEETYLTPIKVEEDVTNGICTISYKLEPKKEMAVYYLTFDIEKFSSKNDEGTFWGVYGDASARSLSNKNGPIVFGEFDIRFDYTNLGIWGVFTNTEDKEIVVTGEILEINMIFREDLFVNNGLYDEMGAPQIGLKFGDGPIKNVDAYKKCWSSSLCGEGDHNCEATYKYVIQESDKGNLKIYLVKDNYEVVDRAGNTFEFGNYEYLTGQLYANVDAKVEFKTLETKEEAGKVYVKAGKDSTVDSIKLDIDTEALAGKTVEIENLTEDGKIKTGSTITIDGNVQCIIVVNGDVDGDGAIDFIGDIITANNYRLELIDLEVEQKLASDIDGDGKVDFMKDLIKINNYRLGLIESL